MIKEFIFEIGENNRTHKREIKKAERVLFKFGLTGFNICLSSGFWIDKNENRIYKEKSFKISYLDFDNFLTTARAINLKELLKRELKQKEILLTATDREVL